MQAPIVKWVGGKGRLVDALLKRVPKTFGRYYEPFAGGAALFFALAPGRAVLNDANAELMGAYMTVSCSVDDVIANLERHARMHSERHYYDVRETFNAHKHQSAASRAAAMLYLNRVCFNGLWRVNAAGEFNVPIGDYKNPTICNDQALREAAQALARAAIRMGDYAEALHDVQPGDLVYIDPPYDETYAGYTAGGFDQQAQRRLAEIARDLAARGVHVMLSNSDTPFVRELYDGFVIERVKCAHAVSASADGRSVVAELIITGGPAALGGFVARKQTEIPGTRIETDVPLVVVESGQAWLEDRRKALNARETAKTSLAATLQLMASHKVEEYEVKDPETGERVKLRAKVETKLSVVKVRADGSEEEFGIGEGFSDEPAGPHPSLIRQAEADQLAQGVRENEDGDVVPPDTAAPKAKRKSSKAKANGADPVVTTADGKKRSVPKRGGDVENPN